MIGTTTTYREIIVSLGYKYDGYLLFGDLKIYLEEKENLDKFEKDLKKYCCKDCGKYTWTTEDAYMVTNDIWAVWGVNGMLCMHCLEKRLGHKLALQFFTDCTLNKENANIGLLLMKEYLN